MLLPLVAAALALTQPGPPAHLRCEYLTDPLGVDAASPRLSWIVTDPRRGAIQSAYQIVAASSPDRLDSPDLWDSGKVQSRETAHIRYAGSALTSAQCIHWRVRTWDGAGAPSAWSDPARWTMGLLAPGDWTARWIGIPGAGTPGAPAHNGYHSELAASADTIKWVTIDLGRAAPIDAITLFPARPFDWVRDAPGLLFPVRYRIEGSSTPDFAAPLLLVDRTAADEPNPGTEPRTYRFPAATARYIRLTATRLASRDGPAGTADFGLALAEMQALSGAANVALHGTVTAADSIEHNSWSTARLTDGDTTSHRATAPVRGPCPMLRREFEVAGTPTRALLFITARGLYEARLNGQRIGDHQLAPEWTDYHTRIQYQTYDVTDLVREGANALGVTLGHGWYAGKIGLFGAEAYGSQLSLLAQLRLEHADGTVTVVGTDEQWRGTNEGPIRAADLLDGEMHDSRRAMPGWDAPGFDAAAWRPVQRIPPPPLGEARPPAALVAQPNEPIRITQDRAPTAMTQPEPGVFVFDMGQNMPGWVRLTCSGPAGTTVTLQFAEMLDENGHAYTANLRAAAQRDAFILAGGGEETFEPRFTYHGFRFVEVRGLAAAPRLVGRVVHSDAPIVGEFECSDDTINRLMSNINWTQYANLMSVPTDCPQRDERLGWMGDAQIFAQTAIYHMDMAAFFTKWCRDIRDAQHPDGRYPDVAPNPRMPRGDFLGAPGWGDAGVIVPYRVIENYGDVQLLEEHYESAKRWIEYIRAHSPEHIWTTGRGNDYGDWLNSDTLKLEGMPAVKGELEKEAFATACYAQSVRLLARTAMALGRAEDARALATLADSITEAWTSRYVAPDGAIAGETQAGYALALDWQLLRPVAREEGARRRILPALDAYNGHLSTGFHSTLPLMNQLVLMGEPERAYALIQQRTPPSWAYMIDQGATTMWERWDGYVKGRGFQDPGMNSFNHFAFGAVGEWIWRNVGGVGPGGPGWVSIDIGPVPGGGVTHARAGYRSIRGDIRVEWRLEGDTFRMDATIPPNTNAHFFLAAPGADAITESGRPLSASEGVRIVRDGEPLLVLSAPAGTYHFVARTR